MDFLDKDKLEMMRVKELEKISYDVTAHLADIRKYAILVQQVLGYKNEQKRVSKMLGREVHIIEARGISSKEAAGTPDAK